MSVEVIGKIVPKNNGKFFLMDAANIEHEGKSLLNAIPIPVSQSKYEELKAAGEIDDERYYVIVVEDA